LFCAFGEFAKVADVTSVYQRSIRKAAKLNLLPRQKFDAKEQPIKDTCTEIGCHNHVQSKLFVQPPPNQNKTSGLNEKLMDGKGVF